MISIIVLCIFVAVFFAGCVSFSKVKREADERFSYYEAKANTINTTYGQISYIDGSPDSENSTETIFSVHGICGGYDQAYEICEPYVGK